MNPSEINSISLLANYLQIERTILEKICKEEFITDLTKINNSLLGSDLTLFLSKHSIPKRDGTFRTVYSPISDTLINTLKILNSKLKELYTPPPSVHGFIKGRSIKSNASVHLAKKHIYKADINQYFESIDSKRVINALEQFGFTTEISVLISKIVTYKGVLPQGFHTSPIIANMVFSNLDNIFAKIDEHISYSRYADDLYFSSNNEFDISSII